MAEYRLPIRDEVRKILPYNAGLTVPEVQFRYAPSRISKLGSNENPMGPSEKVHSALVASYQTPHFYPDPAGRELREELARRYEVTADRVILGNGSEDLLSVICRAVLRPGDQFVTLYPSFPLHEDYAVVMGASVNRVEVREDLTIDTDALTEALRDSPRMMMFSNPMNPVGSWLSPAELARVIAAMPGETLLVIDEAYAEYAAGPDYPSAAELLNNSGKPWISLRTFSKAWGLAGLRIGYGIASGAELAAFLDRVRTPFNTNGPAQAAALAALSDVEHVRSVVEQTLAERERIRTALSDRGYKVVPSKGNFLFFDCGADASVVSEQLLHHGVIIKPWKQEGYQNFIRVSTGTPLENDHFLKSLDAARTG